MSDSTYNLLVIGSGGREHALAWKLSQNPNVNKVFVAPGNAGTTLEDKLENVAIKAEQQAELVTFAKGNNVKFTLIGPEAPLVDGIVDYFQENGLLCFGPSAKAAQLEGSKSFTKDFLARHDIPTAKYEVFTDQQAALNYLHSQGAPIVIKADGLAAGKGVVVAMTIEEAEGAIKSMLEGNQFGEAGHRVVIEDFLSGEEASFIVITDGENIIPFATSQDHKRVGNGDTGPNTGGMGAYSPAPVVTDEVYEKVMSRIIRPTVDGMASEGNRYVGFLYAGLMINEAGDPYVIEYNCRFGDPETQPIMMRMQSDLADLCVDTLEENLQGKTIEWTDQPAMGVVMAATGYPGSYPKGAVIEGFDDAEKDGAKIFHAGTDLKDQQVVSVGGRVLCATALGKDIEQAQQNAYKAINAIQCTALFYRDDIGYRAINKS